ncbi:putative retrotransposon gag domain-containing protein [Helianthus annuus]|nr:putative retrotransposon gag domain-containing protein [Helianthus annuus]
MMIKNCPHHGIELWELMNAFHEGLSAEDARDLMSITGGTFGTNYENDDWEFLESMATTSKRKAQASRRARPAIARPQVHAIDDGHAAENCQGMLEGQYEEVLAVQGQSQGGGGRNYNNMNSNTYHPGLRNHPNFRYGNPSNQANPNFQGSQGNFGSRQPYNNQGGYRGGNNQVVSPGTLLGKRACPHRTFVSCKPWDFTREKGAVDCMTWLDEMDTVVDINGCAEKDVWRSLIQATGKIPLYNMTWDQFVTLIKENYCPQHEVEKIESDFLSLVMKNLDCQAYLTSFNTMSRLVPYFVTPEPKRISRFIGGLAPEIKASMKASRLATFRSIADISLSLTLDAIRQRSLRNSDAEKRKREDDNSRRSDKKRKGNNDHKKGFMI